MSMTPGMTQEAFAQIQDGQDYLIEMVKGYEAKLLEAFPDYPPDLLSEAVMQWHGMLMSQITQHTESTAT